MAMTPEKKQAFCRSSGRRRFKKGGLVVGKGPKKYFDDGGTVTALGGPGTAGVQQNAANPNTGLMGNIGAALGLNNNFVASAANLQPGTNAAQLNNAYSNANNAIQNQRDIYGTLQPGIATGAGVQNQIENQELAMSRGEGPNPALAELNQATAANTANTASEMAGARGASTNAGLLARNVARQGADTQQQAAGQASTLEAQQQIAAQDRAAGIAQNQISQGGQAATGLSSAEQNEQANLQNANTSFNNAQVGMQSNVNNVNSQTAGANQNMGANILGGVLGGVSSITSILNKGGVVKEKHVKLAEMNAHSLKHYDEGGEVEEKPDLGTFKANDDSASAPNVAATSTLPADQTDFSKAESGGGGKGGGGGGASGIMSLAALLAEGGQIQANPLMAQSMRQAQPTSFAKAYFSPSSASNGPNVQGTSALPTSKENFNKDVKQGMSKPSDSSPNSKPMTDDEAQQGYLDADAKLGVSGVDNQEDQMPADNSDQSDVQMASRGGNVCHGPHKSHVANYLASGGRVPAMVSPGEIYLTPQQVARVVQEGVDPARIGEKFKGHAKVKGDSLKNDTIPRNLEEGGVVIDRKNMGTREKRELFVHRAIARKKARG